MEEKFCCCNSGNTVKTCCGPFLAGQAVPGTPEQLMRSRYAAFFYKNIDYLIATRDPDYREIDSRRSLADSCDQIQWLGLLVIKADDSQLAQGVGFVEFAAFYDQNGPGQIHDQIHDQIHEKARFVNRDGRWYYCDGQLLPPVVWGRNQLCWCGSHKKYKRCHGGR